MTTCVKWSWSPTKGDHGLKVVSYSKCSPNHSGHLPKEATYTNSSPSQSGYLLKSEHLSEHLYKVTTPPKDPKKPLSLKVTTYTNWSPSQSAKAATM